MIDTKNKWKKIYFRQEKSNKNKSILHYFNCWSISLTFWLRFTFFAVNKSRPPVPPSWMRISYDHCGPWCEPPRSPLIVCFSYSDGCRYRRRPRHRLSLWLQRFRSLHDCVSYFQLNSYKKIYIRYM